jgi:hypothetical protein
MAEAAAVKAISAMAAPKIVFMVVSLNAITLKRR